MEVPTSEDELAWVDEEFLDTLLVANMTEDGKTPMVPADNLGGMGFDDVLFPTTAFKAVCKPLQSLYADIFETETQTHLMDRPGDRDERNEISGLPEIRELEERYEA